jgi:hypothetical protein
MLTRTTLAGDWFIGEGTVRTLAGLVAVMLMAMLVATPAWARVVRMQTVVNLADRSDPAVKRAVKEAFDTSLRGAVAMGFARIRVDGIQVLQDVVVLATVATDEDDDDEAPDNTRDQ